MRVAAIDCGTNSIRLLIADVDDGGHLTDVVREMRVVRLGEGVDATGRLSEAALQRTFEAAEEYARLIGDHGADQTRFVATSATRDAANRNDFTEGIRQRLDVEPEVISGDEEAALSFAGAASVLDSLDDQRVLVVDIGGGSTEFVAGGTGGVIAARSMDMGCVRFTERFLKSDPPTDTEIHAMTVEVESMIETAQTQVDFEQTTSMVGVAGSITTVAAHALALPAYVPEAINGSELDADSVRAAATGLLSMTRTERTELPYMHPGRVDVIGAGALIWRTIVERLVEATGGRLKTVIASEHDILDGIALSIATRTKAKQ